MLKYGVKRFDIINTCRLASTSTSIKNGPGLHHFIGEAQKTRQRKPKIFPLPNETNTYLNPEDFNGNGRTVKFLTYGCQMNVNDMEIVRSVLFQNGYIESSDEKTADIVLLMTCSIRESAEEKIWRKLNWLKSNSKHCTVGVLGCMAERIREGIIEKSKFVDLVAGPDAYRDLPRLLAATRFGQNAMNVQLSFEETYADIQPVRTDVATKSAYVSIMRGCDNMCTYCIVPFTRGKERSRPLESIIEEVKQLSAEGFKQIILLGQNVNSYRDTSQVTLLTSEKSSVAGFKTIYKPKSGGRTFATLLEKISDIDPEIRIRFTSPHPKDFPLPVINLIKERTNICNQLHLPAQSGDNQVLDAMGRGYTRELYLDLVEQIREIIPNVSLTSDFIAGFCGENDEAHQRTLDLIRQVGYFFCFVFPYSMREKTRAHRRLVDDVPEDIKQARSNELAAVFREVALKHNKRLIGTQQLVLVEGISKRSPDYMVGKADCGVKVIIPNVEIRSTVDNSFSKLQAGDYVAAKILSATSQTLAGNSIYRTTLASYHSV
uniref:CDK5RAP1-like protein n=1 Tax=Panagrolaimus superbus TaxID=310955 RepID=A0A914Z949_9BILA